MESVERVAHGGVEPNEDRELRLRDGSFVGAHEVG
jgi:hypothetical protein